MQRHEQVRGSELHKPRQTSRWIRRVALIVILVGPMAAAVWETRPSAGGSFDDVPANDTASGLAGYLAERYAAVDRLLPEGTGGTRFVAKVPGGNGGMALAGSATILVNATAGIFANAESTELHERAHLAHAFLPDTVGALLKRIAPPEPDEYAAKNPGEHFGEMASEAWDVLVDPRYECDGRPLLERLDDAERRVPGTAGFVVWYLRDSQFQSVGDREQILTRALELSEPLRVEWDAIYAALEARRLPDGTFRPWSAMSARGYLGAMFSRNWHESRGIGRLPALTLLPSLGLLTALDWVL